MTLETKTKQHLASLYVTLSKATKKCPKCTGLLSNQRDRKREAIEANCSRCQGTGEVAKFPEFRQECECYKGDPHTHLYCCNKCLPYVAGGSKFQHSPACINCDGKEWQIRARGHLEDGLEGLTINEAIEWKNLFSNWLSSLIEPLGSRVWTDLMPPANEILAMDLELLCKAAKLEVPSQ